MTACLVILAWSGCVRTLPGGGAGGDGAPPVGVSVLSLSPYDAECPAIARAGDRLVVAWRQEDAGGHREVMLTVLDGNGGTVVPPFPVSDNPGEDAGCPGMAQVGNGVAVVWDQEGVYFAKVAQDGAVEVKPTKLSLGPHPSLAQHDAGFGAVYLKSYQVAFRSFNAQLAPLTKEAMVSPAGVNAYYPQVCKTSHGWIVVWKDDWSPATSQMVSLDATGAVVAGPLRPVPFETHRQVLACAGDEVVLFNETGGDRGRWLQVAVFDHRTLAQRVAPARIWRNQDEYHTLSVVHDKGKGDWVVAFEAEQNGQINLATVRLQSVVGLGFNDAGLGDPDGSVSVPYADSGAPLGMPVQFWALGWEPRIALGDGADAWIVYQARQKVWEVYLQRIQP